MRKRGSKKKQAASADAVFFFTDVITQIEDQMIDTLPSSLAIRTTVFILLEQTEFEMSPDRGGEKNAIRI